MPSAKLLIGDVFDRLAELPDNSVDLIMTSPPFLALRSYLPADDPNKGREIGSEKTPAAFLDTLLSLTAEWRRVLTEHGSICVELGDTYAGSGGAGGDYYAGGWKDGQRPFGGSAKHARVHDPSIGPPIQDKDGKRQGGGPGWPLAKSLCGIPTLFAWSLAYGVNLLTGEASPAGQWRVRNIVHWVRPNPPVGSLADKFRPATSYLIVACTSRKRWFDLDAVRMPPVIGNTPRTATKGTKGPNLDRGDLGASNFGSHPAGAPPLDWWKMSARGYKGAHYATFPPELCERPIKAMCPQRVCVECGEPERRLTTKESLNNGRWLKSRAPEYQTPGRGETTGAPSYKTSVRTIGWTDCGHNNWRNGLVLDPFAGTCTTLQVAHENGRDSIGIDIDARNADLSIERLAAKNIPLDVDYGKV